MSKALAELARQSGTSVEDRRGGPDDEIRLDVGPTTFWPALDALAVAAGARVDLYPRDNQVALARRPVGYRPPPVSYSGLFRTAVKRVTAARDFETGADTYTALLEVAWEPHLQPLLLETSPRGLAVRAGGGPLPAREEGSTLAPVDGRLSLAFDVPLPAVPRAAPRLTQIAGKLSAVAPSKMLTFTFDALDRLTKDGPARRQTQDGVSCRVTGVVLSAERWTVQVAVDYPPGAVKLESYQSWVVNNEMVLVSRDGTRRLPAAGYVLDSSTGQRAVLAYHFLDKGKAVRGRPSDWRVSYRTPAGLVEVPFSFSFEDVPLP